MAQTGIGGKHGSSLLGRRLKLGSSLLLTLANVVVDDQGNVTIPESDFVDHFAAGGHLSLVKHPQAIATLIEQASITR